MKMTTKKALCFILCTFILLGLTGFALADNGTERADFSVNFTNGGYYHDYRFNNNGKSFVIDVSSYNKNIDFAKVYAAGIDGVMLRIGYRGYATGTFNTDTTFADNYTKAKAAGLKVGVYFYGQPDSTSDAADEASYVLGVLGGRKLDLPVAYDLEYAEEKGEYIGRLYEALILRIFERITPAANKFCDAVKASGYDAMVYTNKYMLTSQMNTDGIKYPIWMASYSSGAGYDGDYVMWQYTAKGTVDGINGNVDLSVLYTDEVIDAPVGPGSSEPDSPVTNPSVPSSTQPTSSHPLVPDDPIVDGPTGNEPSSAKPTTQPTTKPTTKPTSVPESQSATDPTQSTTQPQSTDSDSFFSLLMDLLRMIIDFFKMVIGLFKGII